MKVPLFVPHFTQDDQDSLLSVLKSGWLTHGPFNDSFESEFARFLGVEHAVSVNSCASALFLSLLALNIKGEVIIPSFTFVATANAVLAAGATPVFADIDYGTCNINPASIASCVSSRTEAIIPVHFAGQAAEMEPIIRLANRYKLALIEDSAETIGGTYRKKMAGSFGIGCFSFYPTKNITTGEGGMITTHSSRLAQTIRAYSAHGVQRSTHSRVGTEKPWYRAATLPGYNFRMSGLQAALGISQLKRLRRMNSDRQRSARAYDRLLRHIEEVDLPVESKDCRHVYQMYTIKLKRKNRNKFVTELNRRGVGASVHFDPPVHRQPLYRKYLKKEIDLAVTDVVARTIVTLPIFPAMTELQISYVANTIKQVLKQSKEKI